MNHLSTSLLEQSSGVQLEYLVKMIEKPEWSEGDANTAEEDEEDESEHEPNVAAKEGSWKLMLKMAAKEGRWKFPKSVTSDPFAKFPSQQKNDCVNIARIATAVQCHSLLSGHFDCHELSIVWNVKIFTIVI